MPYRRVPVGTIILLGLLTVALGSCSGSPGEPIPVGAKRVAGAVVLPTGVAVDLAALAVVTPFGEYPVGADGRYAALVSAGAKTELGVQTAAGDLLLLGVTGDTNATLSTASTSEALLYYLVGGMWLPADQQDTVRDLLRARSESGMLTPHLDRLLQAGGNGLLAPDAALEAALTAAHAGMLGDAGLRAAARPAAICPALAPAQAGQLSVIIHEGTTRRAGSMVLHNENGLGIVAMNGLRRPGALLAYEVSWQDVDQNHHDVEPPQLAARVEVPATGNLEFFAALEDIITGDAPWAPVFSEPLLLAGHENASMTQYEVVLIGPSASGLKGDIWHDSRFASLQEEWEEVAFEKSVELFLDEMLVPLIEVYTLGAVAKFDAAALKRARDRVRIIYDKHLMGLGVFLKADPIGGYAAGLRFVIEEMVVNKTLRSDMIGMLTEALGQSEANKLSVEALDKKLASRAAASAIAAAVETVLVGGDITKIVTDLVTNPMTASWQVEAMPARFLVDPPSATITTDNAVARFEIKLVGEFPSGNVRFRWSTSGKHGVLYDLLTEDVVVDTTSPEIWYYHNDPAVLNDHHVDSILLEVFVLEDGVTVIPPDAKPLGKGQALVRGERDPMDGCVWECDETGLCTIYCP